MREIEIKARLRDKDKTARALVAQGAKLSSVVTHHDVVYGEAGIAGNSENTSVWLRIRTETIDGKSPRILFTLKRSVSGQLDSIEHETEVASADVLASIIDELGFVLYSDLTKTRQTAHLGDVEICLDNVPPLGDFIEAERLCSNDVDHVGVVADLWKLLDSLGIDRGDEIQDGYDVLMEKHKAQSAE